MNSSQEKLTYITPSGQERHHTLGVSPHNGWDNDSHRLTSVAIHASGTRLYPFKHVYVRCV